MRVEVGNEGADLIPVNAKNWVIDASICMSHQINFFILILTLLHELLQVRCKGMCALPEILTMPRAIIGFR